MKTYQLILIVSLIIICYTQTTETCSSSFKTALYDVCDKTDSQCGGDEYGCFRRGCQNGNKDQYTCRSTLPSGVDLHKYKCAWLPKEGSATEYECRNDLKICTDYNVFGNSAPLPDGGDTCSGLKSNDDNNEICVLEKPGKCVSKYIDCTKVPAGQCGDYEVVKDFSIKCRLDTTVTPNRCVSNGKRNCGYFNGDDDYNLFNIGNNKCINLDTGNNNEKCIYLNGICRSSKLTCELYNTESSCKTFSSAPDSNHYYNMPLNQINDDYDYSKKCVWDVNSKICTAVDIMCSDYDGNEYMCDAVSKCIYDSSENKCFEKYENCNLYSQKEINKNRTKCENSLLPNIDKKCDYILGKDECRQKNPNPYATCSDYNNEEGDKDRIICESIRTTNPPYYCVLDKDNQCIERALNCSEVYNEEDCLHIAKASDPNKKCAFKSNKCVEEYIRCEDFIDINLPKFASQCRNIKLYNGLQCESESDRCKTRNKICSEANTFEECKLIAKTGVTNPERKVCDYIGYDDDDDDIIDRIACGETFKFCSDYRGTNRIDCENIKPYDKEGEKIDELSKCVLENEKCQRVPKDCSDADNNPILCNEISHNIKDNSTKYCRYDRYENSKNQNKCIEDYKTCDSYKRTSMVDSGTDYDEFKGNCSAIIPQNYEKSVCKVAQDLADDIYKCVADDTCKPFNTKTDNYRELCNKHTNSGLECLYDSNSNTCKDVERTCNDIRFYTEDSASEEYCNRITPSKPYKKCTLKEDKSGCKEIYIELDFSTADSSYKNPPGSESVESSEIINRIHLIMILFCLLF